MLGPAAAEHIVRLRIEARATTREDIVPQMGWAVDKARRIVNGE
jgi:hypothetical protein